MTELVGGVLMLTGSLLAVIAGLGLQRFPDVFARMHAASKPATLGLILVLSGAALQLPNPGDVTKLLLVVALQLVTTPLGAHLLGRAAYRTGTEMAPDTTLDELAGVDLEDLP